MWGRVRALAARLPRPNVALFIRNVTILLLTVGVSFTAGVGYGSWKTASTIYYHGPEIAGALMDTSMRLWGFHRDPEVFQWNIQATGAWASDWEEVSELLTIGNDKDGKVAVGKKNQKRRKKG